MYRHPLVSIGANFWGGTKKLLFFITSPTAAVRPVSNRTENPDCVL